MAKESKHTSSSFLVAGGQVLSLGIRFVTNIALAWFLMPADFGVAAIVGTVLVGMSLFSDVGIRDSVIRHESGDSDSFNVSAQLLQVVRGVILYIVLLLLGPLLAGFYDVEILDECLMLAGLSLVFEGMISTRFYIFERNVDVMPGLVFDFVSQLAVTIVIVVLAYFYRSVWVLMFSYPIGTFVKLLISHYYANNFINPFKADVAYVKEIISFGKWILLSTLFSFVVIHADTLIIAKLVDISSVGIYQLAGTFAALMFGVAASLTEKIVYPAIAEASRGNVDDMSGELDKVLQGFMPVILAGTLFVFAVSPLFFHYLYREEYHQAGYLSQVLVIMFWLMTVYAILNRLAISFNHPHVAAKVSAVTAVARVTLGLLGFYLFGMNGFILGLTAGSLLGSFAMLRWLESSQNIHHTYLIKQTVPLVAIIIFYFAASYYFNNQLLFAWIAAVLICLGISVYLYQTYQHFIPVALDRIRTRKAEVAD
ncbi:MAG TPA: hypothetical protein EYH06_01275 [Chromatiales bacterium]|nr:hypothetical protein [Thiotrichales bacterium]HIP67205.1 hypothetical protein [Chromatiales bacterium]